MHSEDEQWSVRLHQSGAAGPVRASHPETVIPENEILTLEEVASYLRLKPQTIYKWAQGKRIPAAKLGKEWRFRRSIIDRWLDDQILAGNPEFAHLRSS